MVVPPASPVPLTAVPDLCLHRPGPEGTCGPGSLRSPLGVGGHRSARLSIVSDFCMTAAVCDPRGEILLGKWQETLVFRHICMLEMVRGNGSFCSRTVSVAALQLWVRQL